MTAKKKKILSWMPAITVTIALLFGGTWKGCVPTVEALATDRIEKVCGQKITEEVVPALETMAFQQAVMCDVLRKVYGDTLLKTSERDVRETLRNASVGPKRRERR